MLGSASIGTQAQRTFWQALERGLDVVARESSRRPDRHAALALGVVVAAAQAEIAHYVRLLGSEGADPQDDDGGSVE